MKFRKLATMIMMLGICFALQAADRPRIFSKNNTPVTGDSQVPIRGENPRLDQSNLANNAGWWANLRDNYHLNTLRILCYREPMNYSGGPGYETTGLTRIRNDFSTEQQYVNAIINPTFNHLDTWINKASEHGFYIIIDYHPVGGHDTEDMQLWWSYIASRYANRSHVAYEICNEPAPGAVYARQELMPRRDEIRAVAPDTYLILWSFENARAANCNFLLNPRTDIDTGWPTLSDTTDWSKACISMHMYGIDETLLPQVKANWPLMNSEAGGWNENDYMTVVNYCEQTLGASWILLDGATAGRIPVSSVYWPKDPYFTGEPPVNQAPTANAGTDQTVEDTDDNGSESVTLDGSASSDSDGTIASYSWKEGGTEIATGVNPSVDLSLGTHSIELTVTDDDGATGSDTVVVTVNAAPAAPLALPGRIEVEDYKEGGEGVGYHDTTAGNNGGVYRTDDVDIQATTDTGGGYNIGWVVAGEWLAFDVDVAQAGNYDITARVASANTGTKTLHVEMNGVDISGPISFQPTGGWQGWIDVAVPGVALNAGVQELKIVMDASSFNVNYIDIATAVPPVNNPPFANAGTDQTVEDTDDNGSENITLDGSISSDADGTIASYNWKENATEIATGVNPLVDLSVGTHTIDLTVTDDDGATASDTVVITINAAPQNQAPTANAGSDQTVQDADDSGSESVVLDGSGSTDADGTIVSYSWKENASEIATGVNPSVDLSVGTHTIDLTVTDDDGATAVDTVVITVEANTPPPVLENLLVNPGFENGAVSWYEITNAGRAVVTSEFQSGIKALELTASPDWRRIMQGNSLGTQDIPVVGGQEYIASAWFKTENIDGSGVYIRVKWYDASGTLIIIDNLPKYNGTEDWVESVNTVTAPANAAEVNITIFLNKETDGVGMVWVDDVFFGLAGGNPPPANNPPVAADGSAVTDQDESVDITLSGSDPDGDVIAYVIVDQPQHGNLLSDDDGDELVTYVPDGGYVGPDSFTYIRILLALG